MAVKYASECIKKVESNLSNFIADKCDAELERKLAMLSFHRLAFAEHPQFLEQTRTASFRTLSDPKYCGKMKVLRGLLSVFHKEHCKVLLFSLSTRVRLCLPLTHTNTSGFDKSSRLPCSYSVAQLFCFSYWTSSNIM